MLGLFGSRAPGATTSKTGDIPVVEPKAMYTDLPILVEGIPTLQSAASTDPISDATAAGVNDAKRNLTYDPFRRALLTSTKTPTPRVVKPAPAPAPAPSTQLPQTQGNVGLEWMWETGQLPEGDKPVYPMTPPPPTEVEDAPQTPWLLYGGIAIVVGGVIYWLATRKKS